MKTTILENSLDANFYINNLALEAHQLEAVLEAHTRLHQRTGLNPGLESEDEELTEKKKSMLEKVWEFIARLLRAMLNAFVKFISGINMTAERQHAKNAEEILKNKKKDNIQFVDDVVKQLAPNVLAVISAIEEDKTFVADFNKNVELDRKITVPPRHAGFRELNRNFEAGEIMERNLTKLNGSIAAAEAKEESARDQALRHTLESGFSITGSENAAYLKAFEDSAHTEKKYEKMAQAAEEFKNGYFDDDVVASMKKLVTAMSKQFALEVKVVGAYMKLTKAVITVNKKIYAGVQ